MSKSQHRNISLIGEIRHLSNAPVHIIDRKWGTRQTTIFKSKTLTLTDKIILTANAANIVSIVGHTAVLLAVGDPSLQPHPRLGLIIAAAVIAASRQRVTLLAASQLEHGGVLQGAHGRMACLCRGLSWLARGRTVALSGPASVGFKHTER